MNYKHKKISYKNNEKISMIYEKIDSNCYNIGTYNINLNNDYGLNQARKHTIVKIYKK
jgi:hypothetical protein